MGGSQEVGTIIVIQTLKQLEIHENPLFKSGFEFGMHNAQQVIAFKMHTKHIQKILHHVYS